MTVRAWLIWNPAAGGGRLSQQHLRATAAILEQGDWCLTWRASQEPRHAQSLAAEAAAAGAEVVIVAGGDGTVHDAVNGLVGTATALAVLPAGTGNVLAAQLGLVRRPTLLHRPNMERAARWLRSGQPRAVDVGWLKSRQFGGRHFLLWAGIGFDAGVVQRLETRARELKRRLGAGAFAIIGARELLRVQGVETDLRTDGVRQRGRMLEVVVANIGLYGGAIDLAAGAQLDDGLLDVVWFPGSGPLAAVASIAGLLAGSCRLCGSAPHRARAQQIRLLARQPLPVHVDAEPWGTTPITIEVRPRSLLLWIPPTAPASLFGSSMPPLDGRRAVRSASRCNPSSLPQADRHG